MATHLVRRAGAHGTAAVLLAGLLVCVTSAQATARRSAPLVQPMRSVAVDTVPVRPVPQDPATTASVLAAPAVAWPEPGRADIRLTAGTRTSAKVGGLPVSLTGKGNDAPAAVSVALLDRQDVSRLGVDGLLVQLGPGQGRMEMSLDYSRFRDAYGADWQRRLRLFTLPACALSTPDIEACSALTPLVSTNNTLSGTVSAQLSLAASGTLVALAAGPSSDAGDYSATSLSSSATWTAGGSSGDFTWSYPLRVPPGVGGPEPQLEISYSAQSVDGRTASTNNQPSWVGEGFDLATSYVERKYATCADDGQPGKFDLCWKYDNATVVLNGKASELVRDEASGKWRLKNDDGSRVEKLTNPVANGDNDREYWRLTTLDGTQYVFGLHQLPGWASGKPLTNSVWTVPVAGDDTGEPCHSSSGFSASFCTQAWRWNLDYAVDPHGNAMTAWYSIETNYYAKNGTASPGTAYHRGGWLSRIDYGQRSSTIFSAAAPARVLFSVAERCIPTASEPCTSLAAGNKAAWPDVPFDQICGSGSACTGKLAPTFFTRKRLLAVTTQVWRGSSHAEVDSWSLTQTFPAPGDGGTPGLWLSKIVHEGKVGGNAGLSAVTFGGAQLDNRVDALEGIAPMTKWRVRTITSETGATTIVNYAPAECTRAALPDPDTNTKRCFPVYWTPPGQIDPQRDWFHKYVAAQVLQEDNTGGGEIVQTDYAYAGGGAWHYDDDDGLTKDKYRTWSGWRGYETVTVTTGESTLGDTRLKERVLYLRGMDGDRTAGGGSKNVTVTDSQGGVVPDAAPLAGSVRERITFNGATVVKGTITDYWTHQTASRSYSWGTVRAHFVRPSATRTRTPLAAGGVRVTREASTFDSDYGLLTQTDDLGDEATSTDDRCTRVEYASNTSAYLISYEKRGETVGVRCGAAASRPNDVVSDTRTSYDGQAWGAAPVDGNPTKTERVADYVSGSPVYQTVSTSTFDAHGRVTAAADALGATTRTAYTPATGGPLTRTVVTNPLGHSTTTDLEPAWGVELKVTDANGRLTERAYDPLGRNTAVWLANRSRAAAENPNHKFAYMVTSGAPVAVASSTLRTDGTSYNISYQIYDSLLRPRQTQTPAPGGGRVITDTSYDSRGLAVRTLSDIYNSSAPAATLASVNAGASPAQTLNVYDGARRETIEIFIVLGQERWRTTTSYGGDRVSVDPPDGAVAVTEISDARGRLVERWQYDGGAPTGSHATTRYGYDDADRMVSIVDTAGIAWTYTYDLRGRKVRDADPDKGLTTSVFDDLDRRVSTTDARGQTLAYTYDALGRATGLYAGKCRGGQPAHGVDLRHHHRGQGPACGRHPLCRRCRRLRLYEQSRQLRRPVPAHPTGDRHPGRRGNPGRYLHDHHRIQHRRHPSADRLARGRWPAHRGPHLWAQRVGDADHTDRAVRLRRRHRLLQARPARAVHAGGLDRGQACVAHHDVRGGHAQDDPCFHG
ncbi:MAG TPA: hypothetical protein VFC19_47280 [Candidatus Limnocylindrales bacterium]|nr:hypothetical protein [Candidatus Limnocylindrales bacterium]